MTSESKTCLTHEPGKSSDGCKVLGYFGTKYTKGKPTKDHENNPLLSKKINRQQENNAIINNDVDKILLNESKKVSAKKEATHFLDSYYNKNNLYKV